jgi:hypothetical protein
MLAGKSASSPSSSSTVKLTFLIEPSAVSTATVATFPLVERVTSSTEPSTTN